MVCKTCKYVNSPQITIPQKRAQIMVVTEAPFYTDISSNRPFCSRGGRLLREVLNYVGLPSNHIHFTYLQTCCSNPQAPVTDLCVDRLRQEIENVVPQVMLIVGADLARLLMPDFKKANEDLGKFFPTIFPGVEGIATIHPAMILKYKGAGNFPILHNDALKIWNRYYGRSTKYNHPDTKTTTVTEDKLDQFLSLLKDKAKYIAYDWETTGLDPSTDEGYCLGLTWEVGEGYCVPVEVVRKHRQKFIDLFNDPKFAFIAFNGMFDIKFNKAEGLPERLDHDPMLMHALLDERPQRRSLENLSVLYCNAVTYESNLMQKFGITKAEMVEKVPPEEVYRYCCKDVDFTLRLFHIFMSMLRQETGLLKVYRLLVMPASKVLADIQEHGFWVDKQRLYEVTIRFEQEIHELLSELHMISGRKINPNSPKQLAEYLWDELSLDQPDLFGRKDRSVDNATRVALLEAYPDQPFVVALHKYKEVYTLLSRYLYAIRDTTVDTDRITAHYHLDRTETGRLATTNFAVHQVPRNPRIRSVLCAAPGCTLIQADYAQIEMRVAAHLAGDTIFNDKIFKAGVDFHRKMASEAYRIPFEQVTKEQRQAAKGVSFGLLYLMSDRSLADNTGLPQKEAEDFVKRYKTIMPGVMQWIQHIKQCVSSQKYVESQFGRKRRFPFVQPGQDGNLAELQREAVNAPIQSTASDITLWQTVKLHNLFKEKYPTVRIIATIHDSIIAECPVELSQEIGDLMRTEMEKVPFKTDVPFKVDITIGRRWGEDDSATGS